MKRLLFLSALAAVALGCAGTVPMAGSARPSPMNLQETDLAVAGWRMPFECLEISERIETTQARLYEKAAGAFSTARGTDERRLRALESRADNLGCLLPGSPYTY